MEFLEDEEIGMDILGGRVRGRGETRKEERFSEGGKRTSQSRERKRGREGLLA